MQQYRAEERNGVEAAAQVARKSPRDGAEAAAHVAQKSPRATFGEVDAVIV
jgi:hypothetical protein